MDITQTPIDRKVFRITVLGESKVGKTSILLRYLNNNFSEEQLSTIGFGEFKKDLAVKDIIDNEEKQKDITLKIFDTAGQERFQSVSTNMLKNASGAILVFDVCDNETFQKIELWIEQVKANTRNIPIVLLGNKIDKQEQRVVKTEIAKEFAQRFELDYFETSAKTNIGIAEAFDFIAQKAYDKFKTKKQTNFVIKPVGKEEPKKKSGCCKKDKKDSIDNNKN